MKNPYASRTHEEMKEVLMSPSASGPSIHYYMIRGGTDKTNITVWESGLVGGEYIKSYGHYHVGKLEEDYTVIQGQGVLVMQVREKNSRGEYMDDEIKSFRAIGVKPGDRVHIPSETGHLLLNTGKGWFVTSDNSPVNFSEENPVGAPGHADYEPFRKLRGAAYYVVEKDGKPSLVRNPNYKKVPEARIE
ncbi:MAG: glucose-6-phosphate isomerase family protein [Minisyncoccia bacterium]